MSLHFYLQQEVLFLVQVVVRVTQSGLLALFEQLLHCCFLSNFQ